MAIVGGYSWYARLCSPYRNTLAGTMERYWYPLRMQHIMGELTVAGGRKWSQALEMPFFGQKPLF